MELVKYKLPGFILAVSNKICLKAFLHNDKLFQRKCVFDFNTTLYSLRQIILYRWGRKRPLCIHDIQPDEVFELSPEISQGDQSRRE